MSIHSCILHCHLPMTFVNLYLGGGGGGGGGARLESPLTTLAYCSAIYSKGMTFFESGLGDRLLRGIPLRLNTWVIPGQILE